MDVGVRRIAVAVRAVLGIPFRLLDLALFHNFLFLDHAASAVLTVVQSFLARGAAAGTVVVILDLRPGDFVLCFL